MNSQLLHWLDDPITKKLLKLLKEHRDACNDALLSSSHECSRTYIDKLIGQINTFDRVLDVEAFFENELDEEIDDVSPAGDKNIN